MVDSYLFISYIYPLGTSNNCHLFFLFVNVNFLYIHNNIIINRLLKKKILNDLKVLKPYVKILFFLLCINNVKIIN